MGSGTRCLFEVPLHASYPHLTRACHGPLRPAPLHRSKKTLLPNTAPVWKQSPSMKMALSCSFFVSPRPLFLQNFLQILVTTFLRLVKLLGPTQHLLESESALTRMSLPRRVLDHRKASWRLARVAVRFQILLGNGERPQCRFQARFSHLFDMTGQQNCCVGFSVGLTVSGAHLPRSSDHHAKMLDQPLLLHRPSADSPCLQNSIAVADNIFTRLAADPEKDSVGSPSGPRAGLDPQ